MENRSFAELEQAGWTARADGYAGLVAPMTAMAIPPMLDALAVGPGTRLPDVACGPGELAAAAAARGALATGLDFAPTMIALAQGRHRGVRFVAGDATATPFDEGEFDAVACAFGLLHFGDPDLALREARRVLKPGGRLAFTVWAAPQQGGRLLGLVLAAIQKHGRLDVPLPPAPPFFRFADAQQCHDALTAAGFGPPGITTVPIVWRGPDGAALVDGIYRSTVRTALLLEAQAPDVRERIHLEIAQAAERARTADGLAIDNPARRVVATAA